MSSVEDKVNKFREKCCQMAMNDSNVLSYKINEEIEKNIKEELAEYQEEMEKEHKKRIEKLIQNHNCEVFQIENNARYQVIKKEEELQQRMKSNIISKIKDYVKSDKYKEFLNRNICETVNNLNVKENDNVLIKLTSVDLEKYGNEMKQRFNFSFEVMPEDNIGGSIGINKTQNILIDNSLKTAIEDNVVAG